MKVLSVFAVITVILLCTTLPAFARSSFGSVTYKGKSYYNLATAYSISYDFADSDAFVADVSIPNTRTLTGNTNGKPAYAHVQLGALENEVISVAPGNTIQFHIRYWFTVRLENDQEGDFDTKCRNSMTIQKIENLTEPSEDSFKCTLHRITSQE